MEKGIDVSSYQNEIDWAKVKKSGVKFAIIKLIRKDLTLDKRAIENVKGCLLNGIKFSFYNYSYATNVSYSEMLANKIVQFVKYFRTCNSINTTLFDKYFEKYIWLDIEDKTQMNLGHTIVDISKAYQKIIEDDGLEFGIYTGLSFYNTCFSKYASEFNNPFWIARYYNGYKKMQFCANANTMKKPVIKNGLWGWQYTSSGIVDGITGNVDLNERYDEIINMDNLYGICEFSRIKDGKRYISKNFTVDEFRCKDGSDKILIDVDFVKNYLQKIRDYFKSPVTINSAYRTESYNNKVGGAKNSYHKKGMAFDIVVKGRTPLEVSRYAQQLGIGGVIKYNTFVHVDSRTTVYHAINNNGKITVVKNF